MAEYRYRYTADGDDTRYEFRSPYRFRSDSPSIWDSNRIAEAAATDWYALGNDNARWPMTFRIWKVGTALEEDMGSFKVNCIEQKPRFEITNA